MSIPIYTCYTDTHERLLCDYLLPSLRGTSFAVHVERFAQDCPSGEYRRAGWTRTTKRKLEMLLEVTERHRDEVFIYTDADVWIANLSESDVLAAVQDVDLAAQDDVVMLCTGFMICRGSDRLSAVFREALAVTDEAGGDQFAVNSVLPQSDVKARKLPAPAFLTVGQLTGGVPHNGGPLTLPDGIKVFHANYTVGVANKIELLERVRQYAMAREGRASAERSPLAEALPGGGEACDSDDGATAWTPDMPVGHEDRGVLVTTLFNETRPERVEEYLRCLDRNIAHDMIAEVVVCYDATRDEEGERVILKAIRDRPVRVKTYSTRPTMAELVQLASEEYAGRPVILSNADIYFDETLRFLPSIDLSDSMLCLTRWEGGPGVSSAVTRVPGCYDTWIFRAPAPPFEADYPLGTFRCDGRFVHEAERAGLHAINPSLTIRAFHDHASSIRHWPGEPQVEGPSREIPPRTQPLLVGKASDDRVYLPAELAELQGKSVTVEANGGLPNIGYWLDPKDVAVWRLRIDEPGTYVAWLNYSLAAEPSRFTLRVDDQVLRGRTDPTGGWQDYRWLRVGDVVLRHPGATRIELRANRMGGALMNCRGMVLAGGRAPDEPPRWWFRSSSAQAAEARRAEACESTPALPTPGGDYLLPPPVDSAT